MEAWKGLTWRSEHSNAGGLPAEPTNLTATRRDWPLVLWQSRLCPPPSEEYFHLFSGHFLVFSCLEPHLRASQPFLWSLTTNHPLQHIREKCPKIEFTYEGAGAQQSELACSRPTTLRRQTAQHPFWHTGHCNMRWVHLHPRPTITYFKESHMMEKRNTKMPIHLWIQGSFLSWGQSLLKPNKISM